MVSPVRGFLPSLAFLSATLKIPNPVMLTLSPLLKASVTISTKASNHSTPCLLVTLIFSANILASWPFFTVSIVITCWPLCQSPMATYGSTLLTNFFVKRFRLLLTIVHYGSQNPRLLPRIWPSQLRSKYFYNA